MFKILTIVPPRNNHFPRSAKIADKLNATKTKEVPNNAVVIILGLIWATCANKGPNPKPIN